jgi:hypothetical protein
MTSARQSQWSRRLEFLQAVREDYTRSGRYDRARRAHMIVQQAYERWADEVFASRAMAR